MLTWKDDDDDDNNDDAYFVLCPLKLNCLLCTLSSIVGPCYMGTYLLSLCDELEMRDIRLSWFLLNTGVSCK
jgi:hypothetical protein